MRRELEEKSYLVLVGNERWLWQMLLWCLLFITKRCNLSMTNLRGGMR